MNSQVKRDTGKVPSAGVSVPVEFSVSPLWCGCVHQPGSSLNPELLGFYRGFPSHRYNQLLTQLSSPFPSLEDGGR